MHRRLFLALQWRAGLLLSLQMTFTQGPTLVALQRMIHLLLQATLFQFQHRILSRRVHHRPVEVDSF